MCQSIYDLFLPSRPCSNFIGSYWDVFKNTTQLYSFILDLVGLVPDICAAAVAVDSNMLIDSRFHWLEKQSASPSFVLRSKNVDVIKAIKIVIQEGTRLNHTWHLSLT